MARGKKKQKSSADDLKERLWQRFMTLGGDVSLLEYDDEIMKIGSEADLILESEKVELPAMSLSVKDIASLRSHLSGECSIEMSSNGESTFTKAIKQALDNNSDDQRSFEYHESEMQRHATTAETFKKAMKEDN